jgi:hypothetical protein
MVELRWEDERYIRVYTRDTVEWLGLSFEAQALFLLLERKLDRAGILELGRAGPRGVAIALGHAHRWPQIEPALQELLDGDWVRIEGAQLVDPTYIAAQEATQSDAARKRAQRERDAARALEGERAGSLVTNRDSASRIVTESHGRSRAVTDGHARSLQPSRAEPAVPSRTTPPTPPRQQSGGGGVERGPTALWERLQENRVAVGFGREPWLGAAYLAWEDEAHAAGHADDQLAEGHRENFLRDPTIEARGRSTAVWINPKIWPQRIPAPPPPAPAPRDLASPEAGRLWASVLEVIRADGKTYALTWLERMTPSELTGTALRMDCPDRFFASWVDDHYRGLIDAALEQLNAGRTVEFQVGPDPPAVAVSGAAVVQPSLRRMGNG